ncbi:hypothetical protein BDV38DRAFT_289370 [Aspergillus pseudotamarii]|uniref:F-box domain-containing protein n=1 Tax=Aspergillus pseudotamarii TaxID=132259 RepID=A0A5N6SC78_ASPPS|nr:uncharacterized protein BDV38DRAFT_289370 [Aspergillus pseudotamarii]KAE8130724.1 hypothetical protein BDV38DRAFT_289370 [Aspergillus pseudotamarii]
MSLAELPTELLCFIIDYAQLHGSLGNLSQSNWRIRTHCAPYLFHTINITFSVAKFKRLRELSKSYIAQHVKAIRYEAPELIDPHIEAWDYFRSCVYTPSEYNRDQRELCWNFHGRRVSYNMIYSYFAELAREQQTILMERIDSITLVKCIPRFLHLQSIELTFIDSTKKPFCWLSSRLFVGWRDSYPVHFETVIDAMVAARRNGIIVRKFKVSGFYSKISMPGTSLLRKVMEALHNVEDLRLVDSSRLLNFMWQVSLPSVRRLELAKCWLSVKDLEEFFHVHSGTLHSLHLEDTWLPTETVHEWGISLCSGTIETIVDRLATIRRLGTLRRLTINEKAGGCYQYKELFDGISTTWSIE